MLSQGAAITALAGRGNSVFASTDDYRVVLPPLPSRSVALNSVLLHGDVSGRPYKISDFRAELERLDVMADIDAFGGYQMNHVWMLSLKTAESKRRVVEAAELSVKGKRCVIIDPDNADVRVKLHWVPFHVTDEVVRKALEPFGKVNGITRDVWRADGFAGIQSTTRLARLSPKEGVSLDRLPHQLRIAGGNVLVIVPGRSPLCLRCKGTGHIRRECRVPKCEKCGRFGHERVNCVVTYATVTEATIENEASSLEMDEEEAEKAAEGAEHIVAVQTTTPGQTEAESAPPEKQQTAPVPTSPPASAPAASTGSNPGKRDFKVPMRDVKEKGQASNWADDQDGTAEWATDDDPELSDSGENFKLPADQRSEDDGQVQRSGLKWQKVTKPRRARFNPATRLPTEEHGRKPPE
ncbi:uncharacterized protein ISCGN_017269 [Ixodes scapularis]